MNSNITPLGLLPTGPGVYLFKDAKGSVLYVGKAKVLRSRVRSYFRAGAALDPAKTQMVQKVKSVATIQTDTENEALIVEATLIRRHLPPYNVVLRDDKYYLFIKITNDVPARVFPVRRIIKDGSRYFGPYSSAHAVRQTLQLLRRVFPYHSEKDSPREVIFPHPLFSRSEKSALRSLGEEGLFSKQYQSNISNIVLFLKGQRAAIINTLRGGMAQAAQQQQYERAAIFRDQLEAIERLEGTQKVYLPSKESFDVISLARQSIQSAANVFQIREGKLRNKHTFLLRHKTGTPASDTLRQFLLQYYDAAQDIPRLILIPVDLEDEEAIARWIGKGKKPVRLTVPHRGKKHQLLLMGEVNAQHLLHQQEAEFAKKARLAQAQRELASALGLCQAATHRVEIYDISNIQGTLATASMAVFIDGQEAPALYRKFRIRYENALRQAQGKPNDFAMIQETLTRRFAHRSSQWPMPDLVIIDGGKGQLSSAKKVLDGLGVKVPVISIAKREEEIFVPGQPASLRLPYDSDALYLIQRMRDEAHRFTISYHRLLRSKRQRRSILDEVPGIGPQSKKRLLRHFGSLKGIRRATPEELAAVVGKSKANTLREYI